MSEAFERALEHVLKWEGGFVNHPLDPGGATNMGITRKTLADWLGRNSIPIQTIKDLSRETAAQIYKKNYWDAVRADEMPAPVAMLMFDRRGQFRCGQCNQSTTTCTQRYRFSHQRRWQAGRTDPCCS